MSKDIFISHAVRDHGIADALCDLLYHLKLNEDNIFCSSLEGMKIPEGKNFVKYIHEMIESPKLVILLLSPHYFESPFCVAELGATWATEKQCFPILLSPLDFPDLKAVLTAIQARKADDKHTYGALRDQVVKLLDVENISTPKWENKRDAFLKALPALIKEAGKPEQVSFRAHRVLRRKYREAKKELERQEQLIEQLTATEDLQEREKIVEKSSGEWTRFEKLTSNAKSELADLPNIVVQMLFHEINAVDEPYEPEESDWREISAAARNGFVYAEVGEAPCTNTDDPKVERARIAAQEVGEFLNGMSDIFERKFVERYDYQPRLDNMRFWKEHLEF